MTSLQQQQPPTATPTGPAKPLGFFRNAMKRKHSFVQFFAMTGIFLLACRSLGQKYRIHDLQEDAASLDDENRALNQRLSNIKANLRREAENDSSGAFAARLRAVFGDDF